jgi:hypothetical protein
MSLQVWDFWKRNVNHSEIFSTCLHHFLQAKMFNPLPFLFKALLHGQKDWVFFSNHLIYTLKKSALKRLGRHGTFKSRVLWSIRDGKGLNSIKSVSKGDFTLFLQNLSTFSPFWTVSCILVKMHLNPNQQWHYETSNLCHHHGRHLQHIHYI